MLRFSAVPRPVPLPLVAVAKTRPKTSSNANNRHLLPFLSLPLAISEISQYGPKMEPISTHMLDELHDCSWLFASY